MSPFPGSNGSESCGAPRNLVKVVASGNRAICAADTDAGVTGRGETDGDAARGETDGDAARGDTPVPQAAARVVTASTVPNEIAFVGPAAACPGLLNRKRSRIENLQEETGACTDCRIRRLILQEIVVPRSFRAADMM